MSACHKHGTESAKPCMGAELCVSQGNFRPNPMVID